MHHHESGYKSKREHTQHVPELPGENHMGRKIRRGGHEAGPGISTDTFGQYGESMEYVKTAPKGAFYVSFCGHSKKADFLYI